MRAKIQRIIAALMASAMLVSFAACGGKEEETTTTTAPDATEATEVVTNENGEVVTDENGEEVTVTVENESTEKEDDKTTTKKGETTKKDDKTTTKKGDKTTKKDDTTTKTTTKKDTGSDMPSSKAEILSYYKNAVKKVNDTKAGFTKTRTSSSDKFDVPTLFKMFKGMIEGFMGMGSKNAYTVTVNKGDFGGKIKDDASGKSQTYYYLAPVKLSESDIEKATCKKEGNNYVITLELKDGQSAAGKGVSKVNKSPLDKCGLCVGDRDIDIFDHKTAEIMYSAIEGTFSNTQIKEKTNNCKVVAKINASNGELQNVKVTFDLECDMTVTGSKVEATGTTTVEYKSFKWN